MMEYFKFLPTEITMDILSRVPAELLFNCKSVCKKWTSLIRHPSFSKMHFGHLSNPDSDSGKLSFLALTRTMMNYEHFQYIEYNNVNHDPSSTPIQRIARFNFKSPFGNTVILGSINGLICLSLGQRFTVQTDFLYYVCNPITNEFVVLPRIERDCGDIDQYPSWTSGFGYVSSTNEYKVVRIMLKTGFYIVHVYTLGSGSGWRTLGGFNLGSNKYLKKRGVFANGALYWRDFELEMVITFDLAEEKFCEHLSPPNLQPGSDWDDTRIGVMDGCLFFALRVMVGRVESYDVWLLKKKNGNHGLERRAGRQLLGWSKEFRVDGSKFFAVTKTKDVLTYACNILNIYNPKTSSSVRLVGFMDRILKVILHRNTLVSLKELGEDSKKIRI